MMNVEWEIDIIHLSLVIIQWKWAIVNGEWAMGNVILNDEF